jgi:hypothetical protein
MKYILEIEVAGNETTFVERFLKNISFIKAVKPIASNEISNPEVLQSIEAYETGRVAPTPLSLAELKSMLDA